MLLPEKVLCLVCSLHLQFISSYTQTYLKPFCSVSSIYSAITAARGAHKPPEARSSQPKRMSSSNISRNWKRNSCSTLGHQSLVNWLVGNFWVEKKNVTPVLFLFASFSGSLEFSELYMQHGFREFQGCIHSAGMSFSYCLMKNERLL